MTLTGMPGALASMMNTSASTPGPAQPQTYSASEAVREFLVLKALSSNSVALPQNLQDAHDAAFDKVCEGIRMGSIVLDYEPEASGCVDMPPVSDPAYMQALMYWCAQMRCPLARLVEAHARIGQFASRALLQETLDLIEKEDMVPSTGFRSTDKWHAAPSTIPLAHKDAESPPRSF